MLDWKTAAKRHRVTATMMMDWLLQEKQLNALNAAVVEAAMELKNITEKPKTPFVNLVMGEDINVQKAQQNLFKILAEREKLIQTYSQNFSKNPLSEELDNQPKM